MEASVLDTCQGLIGYHFDDLDVLALALTHSSVAPTRFDSNERLEFLGDAVFGMVSCEELYRRCDQMLEGDMTKIKSVVVSCRTCAEIGEQLGISELMHLGKGIGRGGSLPASVSGAVFESIVGAIFMDGGLEPARKFVLTLVGPYIDKAMADGHLRNYKSMLQQHAQGTLGVTVNYELLDEKGPGHAKAFEIGVSMIIEGKTRRFTPAWGISKKETEQEAAKKALEELGVLEKGA